MDSFVPSKPSIASTVPFFTITVCPISRRLISRAISKTKDISRDEKLRRHGRRFVIGSFCVLIAGYVFLFSRWTI